MDVSLDDLPPPPQAISVNDLPPPPKAPQPTDWLRQTALAGRAAGEGVLDTLAFPHDAGIALQNMMRAGWNRTLGRVFGQSAPEPSFSEKLSNALTSAGAPVPTTPGEQLASAAIRGVTGGLTGLGAIPAAATLPNAIRTAFSGATGGTASDLARQAGYPAPIQAAAGLAGGMAPGLIEGAFRGSINALRPITRGGQQQIAANVMGSQATNPQAAATALDQAQPIIPGSPRTTGEASQDIGLLSLEKGVRGRNPADFGQVISQQNSARQAELGAVGGGPADIAAAETARDAATTPMRESALTAGQGMVPAPIQNVHATIDNILASPAGSRETVSKAMNWVRGLVGNEQDPARLYEIRKDINDAIAGRYTPSSAEAPNASTLALARGQLTQVKSALDDAIEAAAPGFKDYLARYRDMSKPIDQMKVIQEIGRRAELSSADITTGQNFLGTAAFSRALDNALAENGGTLTSDQVSRLKAIRTDMQYGQAINSPLIKAPGSDTFQNLSIAQVLGAGVTDAHPAFRVLTRPLAWVYRLAGSDQRINQILVNAMLDPKMGAQMLRQATPSTMQKFSESLRMFAYPYLAGGIASTPRIGAGAPQPASAPATSPALQ